MSSILTRPFTLPHLLGVAFSLLALLVQSASAASIAFENCLPEWYLNNQNPTLLQWVPLHVEATYDPKGEDHTLMVAMYGDVKGIYSNDNKTPPPENDPYWKNPNETEFKIPRVHDPFVKDPKAATLASKINFLTYEPYIMYTDFCNTSLRNGTCPLGPTHIAFDPERYYNWPSAAMSVKMNSSYSFASLSATFLLKYGDDNATHVGCVSATVTPDLGSPSWLLKFLPLMILVFVGGAVIFASIWSPLGTIDVFHWSSNFGRDPIMLRLVTPGFGDCLSYIQFIFLTAGLTLNYPGFYQPIASNGAWSALMFNHSIVTKAPGFQAVRDGIYAINPGYGLQDLAQLVGMGESQDVWAGMMVWLLVIIVGTTILVQLGFGIQWIYRWMNKIPEEDLRAKNLPFSLGNVIRIVFNYFLLPIVSLSAFQIVVSSQSPAYLPAMAGLTLAIILVFAAWLYWTIVVSTNPASVLFDDLPTLLLYGPLYNTYSDDGAKFALVPVGLSFLRGIAIGAVQPSGIAQVVILAIAEIVQILVVQAFRPFHSQSSMNAFHMTVSSLRLITILLMIAFIPALGVTEGPRGWVGYAILVIHAGVLLLAFFLLALKTIAEVTAHLMGAGDFNITGQTRGGLSKIFGVRQLSRRVVRRSTGANSRQSQLSSAAMIDAEDASKGGSGYIMPGGRLRSESAGSMGVLLHNRGQRSSSALGSIDVAFAPGTRPGHVVDSGASSAWTPTTPGEASQFSFLPSSPGTNRKTPSAMGIEPADPYYRPPRRTRRATGATSAEREHASTPAERTRRSWVSADWGTNRNSGAGGSGVVAAPGTSSSLRNSLVVDPADLERGATPGPHAPQQGLTADALTPRADYSTREVDFYYGVRGERLNSDAPTRKLGTGPADPTGPMASAAGWWRTIIGGGKSKEKGKGFEVVRSARAPPGMMMAPGSRGKEGEDEAPPEGVPVALGVLRNGPIESDDEDDQAGKKTKARTNLLDEEGNPQEENGSSGPDDRSVSQGVGLAISSTPPRLGEIDAGGSIHLPSRIQSTASRRPGPYAGSAVADDADAATYGNELIPDVPRKSSRRHSNTPDHSRLPSVEPSLPRSPHAQFLTPANPSGSTSRLPFQRSASQKRLSSASSSFNLDTTRDDISDDLLTQEEQAQLPRGRHVPPPQVQHNHPYGQFALEGEALHRPTSFGHVHTGSVERIDRHPGLIGREVEVEVVDEVVSPLTPPPALR